MARADQQLNLRIPADLKEQLEREAALQGRSLTAEIVVRLRQSVGEGDTATGTRPRGDQEAVADATKRENEALREAMSATQRLVRLLSYSIGQLAERLDGLVDGGDVRRASDKLREMAGPILEAVGAPPLKSRQDDLWARGISEAADSVRASIEASHKSGRALAPPVPGAKHRK